MSILGNMKVICAGMSKTGTKSMNAALSELGYNVYDFIESYEYHYDNWMKIFRKGWDSSDFRAMYQHIDAVCDTPACYFWEDILKAFPDSKVILMVRDDEDQWFASLENQLEAFGGWRNVYNSILSRTFFKFYDFSFFTGHHVYGQTGWRYYNYRIFFAEMPYRQYYRRHNAYVTNTCPRENLLVFNCKDGWGPLCRFLGKPIPQSPFPHKNVRGELAVTVTTFPVYDIINREILASQCFLGLLACFALAKFTTVGSSIKRASYEIVANSSSRWFQ